MPRQGRRRCGKVREDVVYVHLLDWPADHAAATVRSLSDETDDKIDVVSLLATGEVLEWTRDAAGLHVTLPNQRPGKYAFVLKVTFRVD